MVISARVVGNTNLLVISSSYTRKFDKGPIIMASSKNIPESQQWQQAQSDDEKIDVGRGGETHQTAGKTRPF